jgi:MFS family permease
MSSTLATAAVTPFVGAISDLIGRRWVALSGLILIIGGLLIIGLAETMAVAIGGNALVGVGSGLAEMIGFAGTLETIPVKSRGKIIGILFLLYIPICACGTFGIRIAFPFNGSAIVLLEYLEMGCLDWHHDIGVQLYPHPHFLSPPAPRQFYWPFQG